MTFADSREFVTQRDADSPLRTWREQFRFPTEKGGYTPVYLCGNSLGLQPKRAAEYVRQELDKWGDHAVDGHFHKDRPWLRYHRLATQGFAELTGSRPNEVVAMNTLTVNLHLLMASFYRPDRSRYRIVIESKAFPSDRYAAASQLRYHGFDPDDGIVEWTPASDDGYFDIDDLASILEQDGDSIALLLLPGVQYYTGQVMDMPAICELGRRFGCGVGLDLAHAIGNVNLALNEWAPDFAAWCTYKYMNAGPGAIAGAFVHEKHCSPDKLDQLHGWWGNTEATRFKMLPTFDPAEGADLWQMSNPPILALAPVVASAEMFLEAGLANLREKSRALTGYLAWLLDKRFGDRLTTLTPKGNERGCQLSLIVRDKSINARKLFEALSSMNVIGDWREPDVIRVAPAPFYNSFEDVFEFAERLERALAQA